MSASVTVTQTEQRGLLERMLPRPWGLTLLGIMPILALCAALLPRFVPAGELIFSGVHALKAPLIMLAGRAVLLAQRNPASEQPEEAAGNRAFLCTPPVSSSLRG